MKSFCVSTGLLPFLLALTSHARIWNVPSDQPTVQQAISVATNGDIINLAAGLYYGPVDFSGKAITIQGVGAGTILVGDGSGSVVFFRNGETRSSILTNVTVRGGVANDAFTGGGIYIFKASPTIQNAVITENTGCGISVHFGAPSIQNNIINKNASNRFQSCRKQTSDWAYYMGGGIVAEGIPDDNLSIEVIGNIVQNNSAVETAAGISVVNAGRVLLRNNVISDNRSNGLGAGVGLYGDLSATVVQNLIFENKLDPTLWHQSVSDVGAGLHIGLVRGTQQSSTTAIVNNTIAFNHLLNEMGAVQVGSQVGALYFYDRLVFQNNLIISDHLSAVDCSSIGNQNKSLPIFDHNDVYTSDGSSSPYSTECVDQSGRNGNISASPLFAGGQNGLQSFALQTSSPAVDSGDNNAYSLTSFDLFGQPRLQNGTGKNTSVIDIGVSEAPGVPGTLPPPIDPPTGPAISIELDPASITLETQHHTTIGIAVTVAGSIKGPIQLTCNNLPAHASCIFAKATLPIDGPGTYKTTVTLDTSDVLGYANHRTALSPTQFAMAFPVFLVFSANRRRCRRFCAFAALTAVFGLTACSGKLPASTDPGTYSIGIQSGDLSSGQFANQKLVMVVTSE